MDTVVFACVRNAGRSQMAAAFFNEIADPRKARAVSGGTEPAARVHGEVVAAMRAAGHALEEVRPRLLTEDLVRDASLLVTMGCGEACPHVPDVERQDWPLDDPAGRPAADVARIRDEIRGHVSALVRSRGWAP